jgi:asparagine synthase (glutamine-hydrolysing)
VKAVQSAVEGLGRHVSGIFGILRFDGSATAERDLARMARAMAHRGPDGHDFAIQGAAGLGHSLMRVTREDSFEAQPLLDRECGLILVADCRLDNREQLAAALDLVDRI